MAKTNFLLIAVIAFLVYLLWRRSSGYADIQTDQGDAQPSSWMNKESPDCVPGLANGAYYTGEDAGGWCGDQAVVHKLGHEYAITNGIGGSLLSN